MQTGVLVNRAGMPPPWLKWVLCLSVLPGAPARAMDLFEAYNLGLTNDPQVRAAEANRNAVQKNKPIGLAGLLPSVVLNMMGQGLQADTGKSQYVNQANTAEFFAQGSLNLQMVQPLFRYDAWVKYWQADFQLAQAQAQLESVYQELGVRVAKAYFDLLYADDIVEFTQVQLKSLEQQHDQVRERLNRGFATIVDLNETEARRDKTAADLLLAEQRQFDAREGLREIIGIYPENPVRLPDYLPLSAPVPLDIDKWSDVAQQGNMAIIAATSASEVAKQNIDYQYAGHLPTLDLQAQQYAFANTRDQGAYQVNQQVVGLNLNVPIYLGGGVTARVEQARDLYEQSLHQVDQQRRSAQRLVKDAFRGVTTSMQRVKALQATLKSARSALEGAQVGYQVGRRTIVDVLLQQSLYFQYWADYARSRYDYLLNGLRLRQAAGALVQSDMDGLNRLLLGKIHVASADAENLPQLSVPKPRYEAPPLFGPDAALAPVQSPQAAGGVSP